MNYKSTRMEQLIFFSSEGQNCNVEVSGNALWMLKNGDCEYPLDVDEWDEWLK